MGALYSGLWWQYLIVGFEPVRMSFYMMATACLVAIIFIDWELYIIPDEINALLLAIGIGLQFLVGSLEVAFWGALLGWGILWGIAMLGRLLFGKDAMGHGDIKMMRGVGAIIGPTLLIANMAVAVIAGLVIGLALIAYAKKRAVPAVDEDASSEEFLPPETIGSLLKFGVFYLLCLDIVGVSWHGIYKVIGEEYIEESIEDDTWKPSLTTIPFGPYLAIGALICMLFGHQIEKFMKDYWDNATGVRMSAQQSYDLKTDRRFPSFLSLTNMKAGISSLTPLIPARVSLEAEPNSDAENARRGSGNHLMNWNKIDTNLVKPGGESGAYCA